MQPEQATLVALDGHLAPGDGGRGYDFWGTTGAPFTCLAAP